MNDDFTEHRHRIVQEVTAERERQLSKGYTAETDARYVAGQLPAHGAALMLRATALHMHDLTPNVASQLDKLADAVNPWLGARPTSKITDERAALIQAAAMCLAAIEQLDRIEARRRRAGSDD